MWPSPTADLGSSKALINTVFRNPISLLQQVLFVSRWILPCYQVRNNTATVTAQYNKLAVLCSDEFNISVVYCTTIHSLNDVINYWMLRKPLHLIWPSSIHYSALMIHPSTNMPCDFHLSLIWSFTWSFKYFWILFLVWLARFLWTPFINDISSCK